jgi:hypothetical protein
MLQQDLQAGRAAALYVPKTSSALNHCENGFTLAVMIALIHVLLRPLAAIFKSKSRLEVENAELRQQLIVLRRTVHGRAQLNDSDRLFLVQLYRWLPSILKVMAIVRPETLDRWHRVGLRLYWR